MINTLGYKVKFVVKRSTGIDVSGETPFSESPQFTKRFKATDADKFGIIKSSNAIDILLPISKIVYIQLVNCKDLEIDRYSSKGYKWIINSIENIERFYQCCEINHLNFNQIGIKE